MGQNAQKRCHCEPVTDVTGVAIPRIDVKSGIFNWKCLKIGGIATPVCGLVRNDIVLFGLFYFATAPLKTFPHGEGGSRSETDEGPYGTGRSDKAFIEPLCHPTPLFHRRSGGRGALRKRAVRMFQPLPPRTPLLSLSNASQLPRRGSF